MNSKLASQMINSDNFS